MAFGDYIKHHSTPGYPYGIGGNASVVWYCDSTATDVIFELETSDLSTIRGAASPSSQPRGVGGTASKIWHCDMATDDIYELDTSDFSEIRRANSPGYEPSGIGGDANTIWHCDKDEDRKYELDTSDFSEIREAVAPGLPRGIGGNANVVWHCNDTYDAIYELSTSDLSTIRSASSISTYPIGIGGDANTIWHCDKDRERVYELDAAPIVAPTVTAQAASSVEDTTATTNGNITDNGNQNCDKRGVVYDTSTHADPGNVAPGASGYANYAEDTDGFGEGAFTKAISSLPPGTTIYYRMYAHNSAGYDYSNTEITFLTKPAAPTSVAATDGDHTDKVVITWTKSTGATGYKVYEGANLLDTLGDVATYDDAAAPAPTITPGAASASDGTSPLHVTLSLAGESANVGASRTYKVVAFNATGDSDDSDTDTGYRGVGALTYQWQRSAADSDAAYDNIAGATTDPYNDTGAPGNGQGRWYLCLLDATGVAQAESTHDRGYRWMGEKTAHMGAKMVAAGLI